jgi:isopenicillin N synthase-like dioxygenase
MTHYPPQPDVPADEFGIAPHVDTTFCTILAQDRPGLTIYSERRRQWIRAPLLDDAFIVNAGELLRTWSNDRFISVKHFANNNTGNESRYSIPFFLNANSDYRMTCIPSCCGPGNPAKYPPVSYVESQAVVQGE